MDARCRRTLTLAALAGALAVTLTVAAPASARPSCGAWHSHAAPKKDVHRGWAPEVGYRTYSLGIQSMLQACGPNITRARHGVYLDSRGFPYGHKFMLTVSTQRSDGKWQAVRSKRGAFIFVVTGKRKIQEFNFWQSRNTSGPWKLKRVHVRHCACSLDSGALPLASTLKGVYRPFSGPEAGPRD